LPLTAEADVAFAAAVEYCDLYSVRFGAVIKNRIDDKKIKKWLQEVQRTLAFVTTTRAEPFKKFG
jgi:arsenate reductase-like glutaredoxin family protein